MYYCLLQLTEFKFYVLKQFILPITLLIYSKYHVLFCIILVSIFGLILLVLTIVFVIRKQRKHKRKTEQT